MILGAIGISSAEASESERTSWRKAMERECDRYGLDAERVEATMRGEDPLDSERRPRRWWEFGIGIAAAGLFLWLASYARIPAIAVNVVWMAALLTVSLAFLVVCGWLLWKRTRFS
jgi:hypothetical protein